MRLSLLIAGQALLALLHVARVTDAAVTSVSFSVKRPVRRPHLLKHRKLRSVRRRAAAHRHPLVAVGCNRVVYHVGMGIGEPVQEVAVRQPHFAVDIAVFINGLICFW